jgi:glycosyltransferase involved in cell wall biosynthesis
MVCLLPARNAEGDLPEFLTSAARVCDAIVALDDGSTDETHALLRSHPLVKVLLSNPPRPDYRGWDDAENRNRLLEAAADLDPAWIISLDADERIDASDAVALRRFIESDALPGCAYGFRHVPMRGDAQHFLPRYQWVYRLFASEAGQRFPDRRLHFPPVPTSIPRSRWVRTTLRIQHLGGMTDERRSVRFQKYLEADPAREYQAEYGHLLQSPDPCELRRWEPRPQNVPVLLAAESGAEDDADTLSAPRNADHEPVLSAIVIAQNDEATIERTVASVAEQDCPEPFEVIVVTSGRDRTAAIVRARFPGVTLVELTKPALPGEARNAGLRVARGTYVSFPGSHIELPPGSLAARLRAHRRGYAMVTGVALNGTRTRAGWASYFLDHAEGLPGHRPSELNGPPAHCSYARLPLLEVGGFPDGVRTGEDTAVNRALVRRGYVALRDPAITFVHRSPCRTAWHLVRHHFRRGRGWGKLLLADYREQGRLLNPQVLGSRLVHHLPRRLSRIQRNVVAAQALEAEYRRARVLIALGAVASWLGMWYEILRPASGKGVILWGRPVGLHLVVAFTTGGPRFLLLCLDSVAGEARGILLPNDLIVSGPDGKQHLLDRLKLTDPGTAAPLERAMVQAISHETLRLPILGAVVGQADALARVGLWPNGARAGWLASLLSVVRGNVQSEMTRPSLLALLVQARRLRTWRMEEKMFGSDPDADYEDFAVAIRARLGCQPPPASGAAVPPLKGWLP